MGSTRESIYADQNFDPRAIPICDRHAVHSGSFYNTITDTSAHYGASMAVAVYLLVSANRILGAALRARPVSKLSGLLVGTGRSVRAFYNFCYIHVKSQKVLGTFLTQTCCGSPWTLKMTLAA